MLRCFPITDIFVTPLAGVCVCALLVVARASNCALEGLPLGFGCVCGQNSGLPLAGICNCACGSPVCAHMLLVLIPSWCWIPEGVPLLKVFHLIN